MKVPQERVLVVESDPYISDLIARQALMSMGYQVTIAGAAGAAIQEAVNLNPDVIIVDLNLPGLSGKDLLVALSSQGIDVPVIVLARKGSESDVIQAFRLGASDFLSWPIREAEVVSAVERVLKQVRGRREREQLTRQLNQTNQELQRRVRELTTILAISKAVTSITDQRLLFDKVVEGAVFVSEADCGWLSLRKEQSKSFLLSAIRNLPQSVAVNLYQPFDDGISSLVALSREPLSIHGEALKRFKASMFGQAALVVPVKAKREVIGLLVVMRKSPQPFGAGSQALLEAVADYAAISLVNTSLFRVLEERARSLEQAVASAQKGLNLPSAELRKNVEELRSALMNVVGYVGMLVDGQMGSLNPEQSDALRLSRDKLHRIAAIIETFVQQQDKAK